MHGSRWPNCSPPVSYGRQGRSRSVRQEVGVARSGSPTCTLLTPLRAASARYLDRGAAAGWRGHASPPCEADEVFYIFSPLRYGEHLAQGSASGLPSGRDIIGPRDVETD